MSGGGTMSGAGAMRDWRVGQVVVRAEAPALTRHTLALYAGASGDDNPIHVDIDFARAAGFPDVFGHGMLTMALLGRALTQTIAPARLRAFSVRFVATAQIGARLASEGTVTEIVAVEGERRARLTLVVRDQHGETKATGEAVVALD
jgi:acyl dehydratase